MSSAGRRLTPIVVFLATFALAASLQMGTVGAGPPPPGALSSNHAALTADCRSCHPEEAGAIQSLWQGIVPTELELEQSALCLDCHRLGSEPLAPHGWSDGRLALEGANADLLPAGHERVGCATCHQEHRGPDASLTAMPDARCQVCHREAFDGLADGHPELAGYPHGTPTGIRFDHSTHVRRHFPAADEGIAPEACTDCHVPDAAGARMLVRPFEATCAACHTDEIHGENRVDGAGLPFLDLFALDVMTLRDRGVEVGNWTADSFFGEVPPTPFLQLLLATDPALVVDVHRANELDLLDLTGAGDEDLEVVGRVARATVELLRDLGERGHVALLERLERLLGRRLEADERVALVEGLSRELVASATDLWLPADGEPVEASLSGESALEDDRRREAWVSRGGWYQRSLDSAILYRPVGHADPFLRAWLEVSLETPETRELLLPTLTAENAPGSCIKCHALEEQGGDRRIRWTAEGSGAGRPLTSFSHVPHLVTSEGHACGGCHALAPDHEGPSPPGFLDLTLSACTTCHGRQGASDGCLTCHRYHEGAGPPAGLPPAALDAAR